MNPATPAPVPARAMAASLPVDFWLLAALATLICLGLVMVASASISIAARGHGFELYYFVRQLEALTLGGALGYGLFRLGLTRLMQWSSTGLLIGLALLIAVLVPGLGHKVNGSMRWVSFGYFTVQASEVAKLAIIVYLAAYLVRHRTQVEEKLWGFIKPLCVLAVIAGLLLCEPDMGTTVVLTATVLIMVWLGGVPLRTFLAPASAAPFLIYGLIKIEPYRWQRVLTFQNPWEHELTSGYQLTQSLIAFGRGEWLGTGLGNSVQKLFYLPEVHTDFIFAVIGEELGFVGTLLVIFLYLFFVWRMFLVGARAEEAGLPYGANLAYGFATLIGVEAYINIGVNLGFLPTKGLTLPFISYGSNSTIVLCCALAIVLRVSYETRVSAQIPAPPPAPPEESLAHD
ncbi:MAG: putative lipid II flippase FtsW [Gammaproteobacteria bacterium]|nr:putative lipid II flippase FtsW [Gammaproteobacteria bacterium]